MSEPPTVDLKAEIDEIRRRLAVVLGVVALFVLLVFNTFQKLEEKPIWDDLLAWLTLKHFAQSLYKADPSDHTKSFYYWRGCHQAHPTYRDRDPLGDLQYSGCPIEGVLVEGPGLWKGARLDKFLLTIPYPDPQTLRVLLFRNHVGSRFGAPANDPKNKKFSGVMFELFDPVVIDNTEDLLSPSPIPTSELPFTSYLIARKSKPTDEYVVLRRKNWRHYLIEDSSPGSPGLRIDPDDDRPWKWDNASLLLAKAGVEPNPLRVSYGDPSVLKALSEAYSDPSDIEAAGFKLPSRTFLQWFNVILGVLVMSLLSPVMKLEITAPPVSSVDPSWTLASRPAPGLVGGWFEIAQTFLSLGLVVVPVLCFFMQLTLPLWGGYGGWVLGAINMLFAIGATYTFTRLWRSLFNLRHP
ncbi:hypothetical protein [Rhizobium leguminosarum]|uniref:hypothetical protein n=1 Tax=Rhizobium leguminosarum TaxID=384 RepID=UPI00144267BF|nr:hypothetical protein [Rhizobium leguminosarum]NKL67497.1 hypothetical protein [Rhizobium leguminosarum bv. viciae]